MPPSRAPIGLDRLIWFQAVAETGSFSKAAARLGVPKSSLSRHIDKLERQVGVRLLHRNTRQVALSTAGETLFERTSPLLRSLNEALSELPERGDLPSGDLRMTAPNDFGAEILAGLLPAFSKRYPAIQLDVRLTNRAVDLYAEGFDLAIRVMVGTAPDSGMVMRRLMSTEIGIFASPSYLAGKGTPRTLDEAVKHDWVVFRSPRFRREVRPPGRIVALADDFLFVRHALRAGAGLGRLPRFLAAEDEVNGRLVQILPKETLQEGRFVLLYPKAAQTPRKVAAFRDFLLDALS